MSLSSLPNLFPVKYLDSSWRAWFASIQTWLGPQGQSGTTGNRPTSNLYTGLQYFDTTLGYPVFVKTVGTNAPGNVTAVWVNASGTPV